MRPVRADSERPAEVDPHAYLASLVQMAHGAGLDRIGVAPATVLLRGRHALYDRAAAGLHDTMQFTYKNPERSTDPQQAVAGAQSVIVAARSYLHSTGDERASGDEALPARHGRVARYAWDDHYGALREGLWTLARRLRADGYKAVAYADDNSMVDREIAYRAGLGWFGKNANLLLPGAGSWFVLGSVVTTAPLPVAAESDRTVADGCGSCVRCLDGCPTGAIVAPGVVDARRCLSWLLQKPGHFPEEFREVLGDRIYGCDDCQTVCPPTVHLGHRVSRRSTRPEQRSVSLVEMLEADDPTLFSLVGRWYLADRDPRWWRRNALVVLGNVADPADGQVRGLLHRYRAHIDPVLSSHAAWADARLDARAAAVAAPADRS